MSRLHEQKLNRMSIALAALILIFVGLPLTVSAMMQATIIDVAAGANLQIVIDSAPVGAVLRLPDGAQFGSVVIGKSLSIESSGSRVITAAPGVQFQVGAKLTTPNADPAVYVKPGTSNVHFKGVEIAPAGFVYDIVRIGASSNDQPTLQNTLDKVPGNISFENVWIHGLPDQDSQRAIAANGANVSVTNSRIDEIHTRGADSQAICAWNGPGPFKIIGNYLEAAGENVLFGGFDPSIPNLIPSNIEARGNYFFKPLRWKVGDPSYAGIHWSIKNLLEVKMGRNIVIDGNTMENSWGDAQIGYAVLFTVRNQDGKAPWATIENISFTNNLVKNSEQGFHLLGSDNLNPSQHASGLNITNNRFEKIANRFLTMTAYANVTLNHNTHEQGGNIMSLYGEQSSGFVYQNNVTLRHDYGIFGDSVGEGKAALDAYTPGAVVAGNVIAGALEKIYPAGNFYPVDLSNLNNYTGTDGLTPGYSPGVTIPTPTPAPTPVPTPFPTPIASPSPLPSPTVTPTPHVCTMTTSNPVLSQWSSGKLVVNLSGFNSPATITATASTGQVAVDWPQSKTITGSSVIVEFGLEAKKKSSSVTVSGPCGSKSVMVIVQ